MDFFKNKKIKNGFGENQDNCIINVFTKNSVTGIVLLFYSQLSNIFTIRNC